MSDDNVQRYDFICSTNEDFKRLITILKADGTAQNISGWRCFISVYESWQAKLAGDDPILEFTPGDGTEIQSEADGQFLATKARTISPLT